MGEGNTSFFVQEVERYGLYVVVQDDSTLPHADTLPVALARWMDFTHLQQLNYLESILLHIWVGNAI